MIYMSTLLLHYKRYYLEYMLVYESTLYSWPYYSCGCLCVSVWWSDHMSRQPHDPGKARTASPNPGPIHAGEPHHKNCRVWRWFLWRQSPTTSSNSSLSPSHLLLLSSPGSWSLGGVSRCLSSHITPPCMVHPAYPRLQLPPSRILPWNAHPGDEAMARKVSRNDSKTI